MLEERLLSIMRTLVVLNRDLESVRQLELPYWCIAAGYVRNYVWDHLHGYPHRTPLNDVDVLYYDPSDLSEETEKKWDSRLNDICHAYHWSCKNQARMHIRNDAEPYHSIEDAMKHWPETATAIGITLDTNNKISCIAPHGLHDLFDLVIRQSPYFKDKEFFYNRIRGKAWLEQWPQLRIVEEQVGG